MLDFTKSDTDADPLTKRLGRRKLDSKWQIYKVPTVYRSLDRANFHRVLSQGTHGKQNISLLSLLYIFSIFC